MTAKDKTDYAKSPIKDHGRDVPKKDRYSPAAEEPGKPEAVKAAPSPFEMPKSQPVQPAVHVPAEPAKPAPVNAAPKVDTRTHDQIDADRERGIGN